MSNYKVFEDEMTLEEAIEEFDFFNEGDYITRRMTKAKDIVLTAYEKEKETSHYNQSQLDIANAKLVEEKEKNKKAIDFINDNNNYFEDGESWQNILKIKEILEE